MARWLFGLQKPNPSANAVIAEAGPHVPVRVFRPAAPPRRRPGLLWLPGGGMVLGTVEGDDSRCRALADRLDIVVVSVGYRLAPEHPYPTPLEDCYAGLRWLAAQPDVDADRVAVGGASAGGGLAAALALLARERGEVRPVMQLLVYPMLDDRTSLRTDIDPRRLRLWSQASNKFGWDCYVGSTAAGGTVPMLAAPARHDDLSGLPRAWIGVGTNDLFHDEDVLYAERLTEAGVACTLKVVEGAFHGFELAGGELEVVRDFRRSAMDALDRALA